MNRALRKSLFSQLETEIISNFPNFQKYKEKSPYIWSGESVFWSSDLISPKTAFLIVQTHPKGYDQFTVELAWSSTGRFPELSQRPSGVPNDNEKMLNQDKAAVRLFSLEHQDNNWIDVTENNIEGIVLIFRDKLKNFGIPYLLRVAHDSD